VEGQISVELIYRQPEDIPAGSAACWVDDNINGATELSGNADVHGDTPT
jgi:hypothetical protein